MSHKFNPEDFDRLLEWLGSDFQAAGAKYQEAHRRLVKHFERKGCICPEDLADRVMDGVAKFLKTASLVPPSEDQLKLIFGFAKKVYLEYLNNSKRYAVVPEGFWDVLFTVPANIYIEILDKCLEGCLQQLSDNERELLLNYESYSPGQKIPHRKQIAERMHLNHNSLRIRICRLRSRVEACVKQCVESNASGGHNGE